MSELLRLNLQFFADDTDTTNDDQQGTDQNSSDQNTDVKTFTQDEMNAVISKRLKQEQKRIREEIDKEYKMKAMSEEERKQEELKEALRVADEYKQRARVAELKDTAASTLRNASIPSVFADYLLGEDEEKTLDNVSKFKETWEKELNKAVKARLSKETPEKHEKTEEKDKDNKLLSAFDKAFK